MNFYQEGKPKDVNTWFRQPKKKFFTQTSPLDGSKNHEGIDFPKTKGPQVLRRNDRNSK